MPGMTTKSTTLAIAAACALLLAACAGAPAVLPHYQAPASGNNVKVIFHGQVDAYAQYRMLTFSDAQQCEGAQEVASNATVVTGDTVTAVPAERFVTFGFVSTGTRPGSCTVAASIVTRAGHAYAVYGIDTGGKCAMTVHDITTPAQPFVDPSVIGRRIIVGGSRCVPLATIPHWDPNAPQAPAAPKAANAPATLDDFKSLLPTK